MLSNQQVIEGSKKPPINCPVKLGEGDNGRCERVDVIVGSNSEGLKAPNWHGMEALRVREDALCA